MGKLVLATLVATMACLALWDGVSAQQPDVGFRIFIPNGDFLDEPVPPAAEDDVTTMAEYFDHCDVYADDQSGPAACKLAGASRFDGAEMFLHFTLDAGNTYLFNDFAPVAASGPAPTPSTSQTPVAPVAGTGHRDDPETYAQGIVAMVLVMGMAVGGSLLAAALRSRRA